MYTALLAPRSAAGVGGIATPSLAACALRYRSRRIVVIVCWRCWLLWRCCRRYSLLLWYPRRGRGAIAALSNRVQIRLIRERFLRLGLGCFVDGGVPACRAWLNLHELIERENASFATFPTCGLRVSEVGFPGPGLEVVADLSGLRGIQAVRDDIRTLRPDL